MTQEGLTRPKGTAYNGRTASGGSWVHPRVSEAAVGRCRTGDRCRWRDRTGPALVDGLVVCDGCLATMDRSVGGLLWDYVDLEQLIPMATSRGQLVSGTREPASLLSLHVEALQRAIWHTVTTWEEIIRERAALSEPTVGVRPGWAVQRAIEVIRPRMRLLINVEPVAVWPDGFTGVPADRSGVDAGLAFVSLHNRARVVLGLTRQTDELYGLCWMYSMRHPTGCGWPTLRRDAGSETVYCANCSARCSWDNYRSYLGLMVPYAKRELAVSG